MNPSEKAELQQLAAAASPGFDQTLLGYLAELTALGCQAKDIKVMSHVADYVHGSSFSCMMDHIAYDVHLQDFLRCVVARSQTPAMSSSQPHPGMLMKKGPDVQS